MEAPECPGFAVRLAVALAAIAALPGQASGQDTSLTPSPEDPDVAVYSEAFYDITFTGEWTTTVTPGGVPAGAHFSKLVGAVHNDQVVFLEAGDTASAGVESMAETGGTSALKSEIEAAGANWLSVLEGTASSIGATAAETLSELLLTTDHPRVTLLTMTAPSPDWFVGVSGLSLLDSEGRWKESVSVDLYPWDAGTEDGTEFSLTNEATAPQGVITSLQGVGKFSASRIGTLTFTLQGVRLPGPVITHVYPGDESLTILWDHPVPPPGVGFQGSIRSIRLRWIPTDEDEAVESNWTVVNTGWQGDQRLYRLARLTNGVAYDVQMQVVIARPDGMATAGFWSATVEETPGAPGPDPGYTDATAADLPADVLVWSEISPRNDTDLYKFTLMMQTDVIIESYGPLALVGQLWDVNGLLVEDDAVGFPEPPRNFTIKRKLPAGTYYVKVHVRLGPIGPYGILVKTVVDTTSTLDAEDVEPDRPAHGFFDYVDQGTDNDYFQFTLTAATDLVIRSGPPAEDTMAELLNADGLLIAANDDGLLPGRERLFLLRRRLQEGTYYVKVSAVGTGFYSFHVETVTEPGSSIADAVLLPLGATGAGRIDPSTDEDYFKIDDILETSVLVRAVSDDVDITGELLDSQGEPLASNVFEDDFSVSGLMGFTSSHRLPDGTSYLKVTRSGGAAMGAYTIRVFKDLAADDAVGTCARQPFWRDHLSWCQWPLRNWGQFGPTGLDINVEDVWDGGNMGSGITVAVVDDGLHEGHPDLIDNVNPVGGKDYSGHGLLDPLSSHGTSVAGIIAARDNSVGGRGVAPRATVYGYNPLRTGAESDLVAAMTHNMADTAVSNNSWGPADGPGLDAAPGAWEMSVDEGVKNGYAGKGVVYVFAAGDGGRSSHDDNANFNGYANYYGVVAVCSVNDLGVRTVYSEQGANLWVCGPSDEDYHPAILTTVNYGLYVRNFGGSSAAAPHTTGVAALVRAANPTLTWRDVKLILAASARKNHSSDNGWLTGAQKYGDDGTYHFNHKYGFGFLDAKAAVDLAAGWENLTPFIETDPVEATPDLTIPDATQSLPGTTVRSTVAIGSEVEFIEFVEVIADFDAPAFRDLKVDLVSPSNTVSTLAASSSALDEDGNTFGIDPDYRFGSARHLGEDPAGTWTLRVRDRLRGNTATLNSWSLKIYGHRSTPGAPTISAVMQGQNALTVTWSAPTTVGASEVTSYDVRYIPSSATDKGDDRWRLVTGAATSILSYALGGLADGVEYDIQVRAVNAKGGGAWSLTAKGETLPNRPPLAVGSLADLSLRVQDGTKSVAVSGAFRDPDADALTFTASSSSPSVVGTSVSGSQVILTPLSGGSAVITVTATDADGLNTSATQTFAVEVANRAPERVGSLADVPLRIEDGTKSVAVSGAFRDPDADALTFTASSSSQSVVTASVSGTVVTLTPLSAGSATITVTATDAGGSGMSATQTFEAEVANRPPVTVGTLVDQSLRVGDGAVEVDVSGGFDDADSDTLTYDASSSAPGTASVMMSGAEVTITPAAAGDAQITVTATDVTGSNTSATQRFRARVAAARGVSLSVEALSVKEGSRETYSVVLDAAPTGPVTVTVDVPSGADLSVSPSSLTFTTGNWNRAQTVTVEADQDSDALADAAVTVRHQVSGADYGSVTASAVEVTIVEDDTPTLSVEDAEASEGGGAVVFRVELSLAGTSDVTVEYETSDGSGSAGAQAGSDYTAASGTLTFTAGSTATQEVRVAVTDDSEDEEEAERFGFTLRNPFNASLAGGGSTLAVAGTILDNDDPSVAVSFGSATYSVVEGSGETVRVRLDRDPERTVTIPLVKEHQDGASTNDYTGIPPSVAFGSGEKEREFVFAATDDSEDDDGESVVLRFGSLPNRVSGAGETRLEILDNDDPDVTVSFGASRYEAPEGGGVQVEVRLSADPERTVRIPLEATLQGGATLADYRVIPSGVTFGSGEKEQEFSFEARHDLEDDDDESVLVRFGMLPSEVNGSGEVTLAILDDDDPEVEVQFGALNYDVTEGGSVQVTLHLSADPERTVTIPLEASHHGGATEADYSGLSDVTFNRGDTEKAFTFSAANDAEDDDGEAVVLRFGALPPRVSGSGETTVAILDTDDSGGGGGGGGGDSGGGGGGPPPSDDEDDEDDDGGGTQPPPPPPPSGPPKADFTLTAECAGDLCRARTGLPVTFEDTSTGRVESRRWDFGDGTGSRNRRIDHAWGEPGFYEVTLSVSDGETTSTAKQVFLIEASDPAGTCVADAETLCLQDSRYAVTVEWWTADGGRGPGSVVHEGTNDSGLFTFFSADNWEVLIKVLDGCAVNGHVWVYGASTTDLGYVIRVTDTVTGTVKEYRNEPGLPAPAITDTTAFQACAR